MQGRILANRFRLEQQLGKGGMGSVWLAEHLTLRSNVAVKLMDPAIAASDEGADRFRREAQAAASLRSAHVVQVLDYGVDEGMPFLVMELLRGENLGHCLERERRLSPERTLAVMTQVARAVGRAHAANIVHRDLKPDNVFLVEEDGHELVKVLDFGIAKTSEPSFGGLQTRTGITIGTPYYMSPEQAEGKREVDFRTDLWAMGVMTSECLTGVRPFMGETWGELLLNICARAVPVPSTQGPVPPGFDLWFARATNRDPEQRFGSAQEFARSLAECIEGRAGKQAISGRAWGQKGATVVHTGPIVALPPAPAETARGHSLELGTSGTPARSRSAFTPLFLALIATVLVGGAAAAVGVGVWRMVRDSAAPGASASAAAQEPNRATGGTPAVNEGGAGRSPAESPNITVGGSPPVIVPSTSGGRSPFEGLTGKGGTTGRPSEEKPRQKTEPRPAIAQGGRSPSDAPKTAQCYRDPFTGAVKPAKGAVPANTSLFTCKYNPFNGQYTKL
jgi:hypothetical protein